VSGVIETAAPEGGERPSPRADLFSGLAWIVFGAAVIAGALGMDRFESQGATLYSMPGLVPGLLGGMLGLLGTVLCARALQQGALRNGKRPLWPGWNASLLLAIAFMLLYALGLVGRLPFWLATFVFVSGSIAFFEWAERGAKGQRVRGVVVALLCGAFTSGIVSVTFEQVFLVRLP
jgi:hypothetical protein